MKTFLKFTAGIILAIGLSTNLFGQLYPQPSDGFGWDINNADLKLSVWAYENTGESDKIAWADIYLWENGTELKVKVVNEYPPFFTNDSLKVDSAVTSFFLRDFNGSETLDNSEASPDDWTGLNKLGSFMSGNYYPEFDQPVVVDADYFGADAGSRLFFDFDGETPPDPSPNGYFTFDLDVEVDIDAWKTSTDLPLAYVRFQDFEGSESGKGFTYGFRDPPPPSNVPEPSQIAFLAVLGLGGLLYTRRRLTKK